MSGALAYSAADNPSLISESATANARTYAHAHSRDAEPEGRAGPSYAAQPADTRHTVSPTDLSYFAHGQAHLSLGGTGGRPPDQERTTHVSQAYHHNSREHYSQLQPAAVSMYSSSDDSALSGYPTTKAYAHVVSDVRSADSHSSMSRSPPTHQDLLPHEGDAQASLPKLSMKRREKPHIELSPDQPLTTQGKQRARVYVACVQCRTRKIRCDGAKPICLHCSRRSTTNPDDSTLCTYDSAPKRRGPDKNPGSRQRISAHESAHGGKVRRRRRRDTGPTDKLIPMAAQGPSDPAMSPGDGMEPLPRVPHAEGHAVGVPYGLEPLAQVPSAGPSISREVRIAEVYRAAPQQPVAAPVDKLPSTSTAHDVSLRDITHPPHGLHRAATMSEPQYGHSQVPAQISPIQHYAHESPIRGFAYASYGAPPSSAGAGSHAREYEYEEETDRPDIAAEPSLQLTRDTWWDGLLSLYSRHAHPQLAGGGVPLAPGMRDSMSQQVTADLRFLFRASNYWFAFFNVPRFFARLCDPAKRSSLQPSLILAALAAANFIRSSEQENGEAGRSWALTLLEQAQASLEGSINARWIDEGLVEASWLIAFFEISPHPLHNSHRVRGALSMLDSLIRGLAMAGLDQNDSRVSRFAARAVPTVSASIAYPPAAGHAWDVHTHVPVPPHSYVPPPPPSHSHPPHTGECACHAYTLGSNWTGAQEHTPLWLMTPAWHEDASEAMVRKEECRRLVWSSVMMVAGYTSFTAANSLAPPLELSLMEPSNYALLFPGEDFQGPDAKSKETIWALYMRTMLLWHSCVRMRWDSTRTADAEKAQFAVTAWLEIDRIEKALDSHTCGVERAFLFQGREYLFNSRMCISFEFQRYIPSVTANVNMVFHRQKAEEWLKHQASIAKRTMYGLQTITGQPNVTLARRPFFGFWFMSQVSRALLLWSCDRSLTVALEVAKALLDPIEYLSSMWPCADQRKRYRELRANLDRACYAAGIPPASPSAMDSRRVSLS